MSDRTTTREKERVRPPRSWRTNSWDEKARENPLLAVMTRAEFVSADSEHFTEEQLALFFSKGEQEFGRHVVTAVELSGFATTDSFIVDYGCGMGRMLRAVVQAGYRCAGVDISPTMLEYCARLVPNVESLHQVGAGQRCSLPNGCASVVYSYAVVQHIASLQVYKAAVTEMCRLLREGGILALQVNCEDFVEGFNRPGRTENFEDYSLHYREHELVPYLRKANDNWSGVYIGFDCLLRLLDDGNVRHLDTYMHNPEKPRALWVIGRKVPMIA